MKQTAVEFLIQELTEIGALNINGLHWSDKDDANSAIEKAKEMEEQQIIDVWNNSRKNKSDCNNWNCSGDEKKYDNFKQYYNETFNK